MGDHELENSISNTGGEYILQKYKRNLINWRKVVSERTNEFSS